jgi:hypothetical protein
MPEYYNPEEKMKHAAFMAATKKDLGDFPDLGRVRAELDAMPVNQMINSINYIADHLIPAIKKKRGEAGSADVKFFEKICDLLYSGIVLHDRVKFLEQKLLNTKVDYLLCRDKMELYERELNKYTTLEDLWLTEGFDHIAKGIQARAEDILRRRQKP